MKIGSGSEVLLRRLFIPIYQVVDAARYAGTPPALVSLWRKGRLSPAQREAPLSYLQLVEFAMVAAIRREGISLQRIRKVRELLRQRLGCELPFATWRFFDEGKHILMEHCDELPSFGRWSWRTRVGESPGARLWESGSHNLSTMATGQSDGTRLAWILLWSSIPLWRSAHPRLAAFRPGCFGSATVQERVSSSSLRISTSRSSRSKRHCSLKES